VSVQKENGLGTETTAIRWKKDGEGENNNKRRVQQIKVLEKSNGEKKNFKLIESMQHGIKIYTIVKERICRSKEKVDTHFANRTIPWSKKNEQQQ
jgi:hypothetical protein